MNLCKYGTHRVIEPQGVLPQAAHVLDAKPVCLDNECLISVDVLNIDSASFHQIKCACDHDEDAMKRMIEAIIKQQGKMQNPVTKSGGMLMGSVLEVGKDFHDQTLKIGTRIATLVSLSLTPLHIDEITSINLSNEQVYVKGKAILFDSGVYTEIPGDIDEKVVLAAMDVAGAPAQMLKLVQPHQTVFIIGAAGKSGILCGYQAREIMKHQGRLIGLVYDQDQKDEVMTHNIYDDVIIGDAKDAMGIFHHIKSITNDQLADVTINVVNVDDTEMTSILSTKDGGVVYFFSMATSFTKAALGAEGVKKDIRMLIGNGYTKNHADITLNLVRRHPKLLTLFKKRYT